MLAYLDVSRLSIVVAIGASLSLVLIWNAGSEESTTIASRRLQDESSTERIVDFNRDIRPLLSDRCFRCHGPDEYDRQAGLRLDTAEDAFQELELGGFAIVPGDPEASILYERISHEDHSMRMPPEDFSRPLTEDEIELFRLWIEQGATYDQHWSFVTPTRPELPAADERYPWKNAIDRFVAARALEQGFHPADSADRETLIRRVTLDLTGVPPTVEEIDAFLSDTTDEAYERVVDRLLESPRFGEHMARYWLDAARYGDTHGLHLDNRRQIWPYRDWVINAFNRNLSFDQFTIEQIAGDLLPNATIDQRVATGFGRCNVTTGEGGSINEEYRVRYAIDRVETTMTVFMGLTTGCAVCHDHKFDPISQHEFYELYSYFYNFAEREMDGNALLPPPIVTVPSEEVLQQQAEVDSQIEEIEQQIREALAAIEYVEPESSNDLGSEPVEFIWIEDDVPTGAKPEGNGPWNFVTEDEHPVYSGERATYRQATGMGQHFFTGAQQPLMIGEGDRLFAYVYLDPENPPRQVMLQFNDGSNWDHRAFWGENLIEWGANDSPARRHKGELPEVGGWHRLEVDAMEVGLSPGTSINGWAFTQFDGEVYWDKAGIVTRSPQGGMLFDSLLAWRDFVEQSEGRGLPEDVKSALLAEASTSEQQQILRDYFLEYVYAGSRDLFDEKHAAIGSLRNQRDELQKAMPQTLVMGDRPVDQWQPTYLLKRGQYDDPDHDQLVEPGVPACLPPLDQESPKNRLGLAKWIVDRNNPLTARVIVNRYWQQLFGVGIVKTSEDFGAQGEFPTHPMLLDWLAVEFMESGWDIKHMFKLMVMSHTYQQSSHIRPEHLQIDPENRYLARGPRFRMDAEMIRDSALFVSGLLVEKIGGPSVRPYQPLGLWKVVGYTSSNTANFVQDHGEALYRRSFYTFWKRTSPPPTMQILDAPSREVCIVRRERTNTPAAALVTLNDVQFIEAARCFAERMLSLEMEDDRARMALAFRMSTSRTPTDDELKVLERLLARMRVAYQENEEAAEQLASVGEKERVTSLASGEVAAWTIVTNTLLNLDEALTKN